MAVRVLSVVKGSVSERAGFRGGDLLLRINGEEILDEIDYQSLSASPRLHIDFQRAGGHVQSILLHKRREAPLGLCLDERINMQPRVCRNHCIFCFVDQMPSGMRSTLYVKDDDWRLSLMMGNFVTLTNVDDQEFSRIIRRKASPLYISVHATDPDTRIRMLRNPRAGLIMDQLRAFRDAGIQFHTQVVLCPGVNDGAILHQTIVDLANLYPASRSLAIVPIGLTRFREQLFPLRLFRKEEALSLLKDLELIRSYYLKTIGTRFVFPADEFYSIAGLPVPSEESYEGYPQIENGIGMLRQLEQECDEAWPGFTARIRSESSDASAGAEGNIFRESPGGIPETMIATGVSAAPYIQRLVDRFAPPDRIIRVVPVENHFFGPSVTVTGLITGGDLISAIRGKGESIPARVLISRSMLRENEELFLDDLSVKEIETQTGTRIRVVRNTGEDFLNALWER